jgi:hypothetical protein
MEALDPTKNSPYREAGLIALASSVGTPLALCR